MAAVIPIVPKAESILLHTGNIANWNRLKRNVIQSPSQELLECIGSTVEAWLAEADRDGLQEAKHIDCLNHKFMEQLPENDERKELKLTVKLCLCENNPALVDEALEEVLQELGTKHAETVLLSLPEGQRSADEIIPVWRVLEEAVDKGKVFTLGTADLDKPVLEELCEKVKVAPTTNQVNLASCCVMPPDLTEFAKKNDITLLTHNDPPSLLTVEDFAQVMTEQLTPKDSQGWKPSWVLRYSVIIKCRGIIKSKGYVMKATRNMRPNQL